MPDCAPKFVFKPNKKKNSKKYYEVHACFNKNHEVSSQPPLKPVTGGEKKIR